MFLVKEKLRIFRPIDGSPSVTNVVVLIVLGVVVIRISIPYESVVS